MTKRCFAALAAMAALTVAALSTSGAVFLLPAVVLALLMLSGAAAVWHAALTLRVEAELSAHAAQRGERVTLTVTVQHGGWLPIAPARM